MKQVSILYVLILSVLLGCRSQTADIDKPNSVTELLSVEIGGMQQWLLIRGEDESNPVLLWLHGGPGSAQMPIHHKYTKGLEKEFVVVHWDQRGAGKSNHSGFREESMIVGRFVADVHEVTQFLKNRFNKDKIILLGHSWGTQIGILAAEEYPEDYSAYISVSQVVHPQRGDMLSYKWLSKKIEDDGSDSDRAKFGDLGKPPFEDHDSYVKFARMKDTYGGGMDAGFITLAWHALWAKEYTIGDYIKWFQGANRGSGPMWEESRAFNLFTEVPQLEIPVWFIAGKEDQNTPVALVEEYYDFLDASVKDLIIMDDCAHTPFIGDPDRFIRELFSIKP
jgi:pimeloyl-ACP methyl ester carboxylesterase